MTRSTPRLVLLSVFLALAACGEPKDPAQNALGGVGAGPAPRAAGGGGPTGGNTSADGPEGERSPSGPASNMSGGSAKNPGPGA